MLFFDDLFGGDALRGGDDKVVEARGVEGEVEVDVEAGVGVVVEVSALGVVEVEAGDDVVAVEVDGAAGGVGGEGGVAGEGGGFGDRQGVVADGPDDGAGDPLGTVLCAVADGGDAEHVEEVGVEVADVCEVGGHIEGAPLVLRLVDTAIRDVIAVAVVDEGVPREVDAAGVVGGDLEVFHLGAVGPGRHSGVDHDDGEHQGDVGGLDIEGAVGEHRTGVGVYSVVAPVVLDDGGPEDAADVLHVGGVPIVIHKGGGPFRGVTIAVGMYICHEGRYITGSWI